MTFRQELLQCPERKWDEPIKNVCSVYVVPTGRKHDSGYCCMEFVAEYRERGSGTKRIRFGGGCDDLDLMGQHFRMDCIWPDRILRIWNKRPFTVGPGLSSISLVEQE